MKTARALLLIGVLGAASIAAAVYTMNPATSVAGGDAVSTQEPQARARLVSDFSRFAGSELNARSLVVGLREGTEISLVPGGAAGRSGTATRFTPSTGPMDYSSIRVALGLAREQLAQLGLARPTPAQIKAVLAGGGVASHVEGRSSTPFLLPGILQMRVGGMSWARIAGTMGVTLAQSMNGAHPADAAEPMDAAHPAAARAERSVVPVPAARPGDPVLRRAAVTKAAPISSVSITTSSAGGPTTPAVIGRTEPARTAKVDPAPGPRRSRVRVVAEADGASGKETTTLRTPDSMPSGAVRTEAASPSAVPLPAEPAPASNDQLVN